jgi:hypothetical protein
VLGTGTKSSYQFAVTLAADQLHYTITATPFEDPTGMSHYFTDESTVIRYNFGAAADVSSSPIPR